MLNKQVVKSLREICKWGYTDSEKGSMFTERVLTILQKSVGVIIKKGSPEINEVLLSGLHLYENPYGSQKSPDIAIFKLNKHLKIIGKRTGWLPENAIKIEVKRSQVGKAMWNSGFPTQEIIYLLNTKCLDLNKKIIGGTTMVMGSDLASKEDEKKCLALKEKLRSMKKLFGKFGTFICEHLRPMFVQEKAEGYWLINSDREKREEKVFKFVNLVVKGWTNYSRKLPNVM